MTLEDLGNIGEFVGAIGVVVSLIYLAIQIRQNTTSVQAATIQSAAQAFGEMLDLFTRHPEVLRLYQAGTRDFEGLSPNDRMHFAAVMGSMLHRFESLVVQADRGLLPPESWDGAANRLRGAFALPGTRAWWERGKHVFNSRLQAWVEAEIVGQAPRP